MGTAGRREAAAERKAANVLGFISGTQSSGGDDVTEVMPAVLRDMGDAGVVIDEAISGQSAEESLRAAAALTRINGPC